jgi:hypothetical protein
MLRRWAVLLVALIAVSALPPVELGAAQKKKPAPAADPGPVLATPFSLGASQPLVLPAGTVGTWASAGAVEGGRLKLPADAGVGTRWLRAATAAGVTPPRPVTLDVFPEVADDPKNRDRETAQELPVPGVVAGKLDAETRAFYRVAATKGKPLAVEVLARRLGSPFDPVIVLMHPDGRLIPGAYADDTPGLVGDCRVVYTPPSDGVVVAEVRDSTYKGGPDYAFRLRVGEFPGAVTAFPLVVARGQTVRVGFAGPHAADLPPVTLVAPADPAVEFASVTPVRGQPGWPVPVRLSDHPQTVEQEPNDTPETATLVTTPGGASARFATKDDADQFRFAVAKGRRYAVQVLTHEVQSPADVFLKVVGPDGKQLAESDPAQPVCRVEFAAPADGDCRAVCVHQNYLSGPAEVYHLGVRPLTPDFTVTLAGDRLTLPAGGVGILPAVTVNRQNEFKGPVTLTVVGDGLTGGGSADGPVGVTSTDANSGLRTARIKATATLDGAEVVRWASVADPVRAGLNGLPVVPAELATTLAVGVRPAERFKLSATAKAASVPAGGKLTLSLTADRADGFADLLTLALVNPPPGVTAKAVTVPKGQSAAAVEVALGDDVPAGPLGLVVKATAGKTEVLALPVTVAVTAKPAKE